MLCKQIGEKSSQNGVGVLAVLLLLLFMRKKLAARESASEFQRVRGWVFRNSSIIESGKENKEEELRCVLRRKSESRQRLHEGITGRGAS